MPRQMVGFDIGECEVKIVHTVGGRIEKAVSAPVPDNLVGDGVIRSMDAMADFLHQCAKENGIPRTHAAVVLPEALAFSRNLSVPVMTTSQLKYNLPYEFKDFLSQEKEKYFYDFAMYEAKPQEPEQMQMFACATLKSTIAAYRDMFRRAGFQLRVAVPEQWAIACALRDARAMEGPVCFVDMGHKSIQVHVLKDGKPDSRRTVNLGLCDLDRMIAEQMHVDVHLASTYKLSNFEGVLTKEFSQGLFERMAVEILKTVNFYNYNNRDLTLQTLCLCGGGSAVEPLRQTIARITDLEVLPMAHYTDRLEGRETYLKAYGCAVSG